jgi:hypothetical protein
MIPEDDPEIKAFAAKLEASRERNEVARAIVEAALPYERRKLIPLQYYPDIAAALTKAREEEREACAVLAEGFCGDMPPGSDPESLTVRSLAKAIRARGEQSSGSVASAPHTPDLSESPVPSALSG